MLAAKPECISLTLAGKRSGVSGRNDGPAGCRVKGSPGTGASRTNKGEPSFPGLALDTIGRPIISAQTSDRLDHCHCAGGAIRIMRQTQSGPKELRALADELDARQEAKCQRRE